MNDYLEHHGILGQKWGIRRFQNEDGSLTTEGKRRYSTDGDRYGRDLDDDAINDRVKRLSMEKRYKELNDEIYRKDEVKAEKEAEEREKRKKEIQKKFIDKALDVGANTMGMLLQNTINYGMGVAGGEIDNSAENFTKYLFTGKGPSNKSNNAKNDGGTKSATTDSSANKAANSTPNKTANNVAPDVKGTTGHAKGLRGSKWVEVNRSLADEYNSNQMKYAAASGRKDDISTPKVFSPPAIRDAGHSAPEVSNHAYISTSFSPPAVRKAGESAINEILDKWIDTYYDSTTGVWRNK